MRVMNHTFQDIELPAYITVTSICDIDTNNLYLIDGSNPKSSQISASVSQLHVSTDSSPKKKGNGFQVSNTNLSKPEIRTLKQFLHQNDDFFLCSFTSLAEIGIINLYKHRTETQPNVSPVRLPCYRQPHQLREKTEKQVNDMLQQGIEQSMSVCNSPRVLVRKKDYRQINSITIPVSHTIPPFDDVFDASNLSILDINSAYFQIKVDLRRDIK